MLALSVNNQQMTQVWQLLARGLDQVQEALLDDQGHGLAVDELVGNLPFFVRWIERAGYGSNARDGEPTDYKLRAVAEKEADFLTLAETQSKQGIGQNVDQAVQLTIRQARVSKNQRDLLRVTLGGAGQHLRVGALWILERGPKEHTADKGL